MNLGIFIVFEAVNDAEAVAKRAGKGASSGRRADDGEVGEVEADRAGGGTLSDDYVEFIIFHRRIEDFFDDATKTMDFVNKENVAVLEVRKDTREITSALNRGARGDFEICGKFVGDNVRHSGLPEARRTIEKDMIESRAVVALFYGVDGKFEVGFEALLADVFGKISRAEALF